MNKLGAHEVMELHEVLNNAISGLNTLKLFRPHAKDQQLQAMLDRHTQAMTMEYNHMVEFATRQGASQAVPARRMNAGMGNVGTATNLASMNAGMGTASNMAPMNTPNPSFQPTYGLRNPETMAPAGTANEIDDADVALCVVGCHKHSASLKMKAALEMADPTLRRMMQHGANACADMAYEGFQYANQKGYYQVPTLQDTTTATYLQAYGSAPMDQMPQPGMPLL
ncbi:spore coat protein [Cohnella algarum]|uniref:spore coat protein n=1 Tax=Cohnella algarum TaxID=2044859 RepID=UPI0019686A70|nr:spore coat protein [Cohnella algarum]MBN2982390.1 spore coat protein [Cohnella algarum]